jgi:hypothetical protein
MSELSEHRLALYRSRRAALCQMQQLWTDPAVAGPSTAVALGECHRFVSRYSGYELITRACRPPWRAEVGAPRIMRNVRRLRNGRARGLGMVAAEADAGPWAVTGFGLDRDSKGDYPRLDTEAQTSDGACGAGNGKAWSSDAAAQTVARSGWRRDVAYRGCRGQAKGSEHPLCGQEQQQRKHL